MTDETPNSPAYLIGISYVGGPEYLRKAIASIGDDHHSRTYVVNSSESGDFEGLWNGMLDDWNMVIPMVPLSHTQTHNYFQVAAVGLDAFFVMHNDAECEPDTIDKLLEMLPTLPKKWGVVFTNYDALAMYNPALLKHVGPWDWRGFGSYYSECDYYYRLKLAGFSIHESGLPVKHVGSHIINHVSKWIKFYTAQTFDDVGKFYVLKWGGHPGHEIFTTPFNLGEKGPYPDE